MTNRQSRDKDFVGFMKRSDEHLRKGVALLLELEDFERFFELLENEGLFSPAHNPGPVELENGSGLRIPYWPILDFLVGCAKKSGDRKDIGLANRILAVVHEATTAVKRNGGKPDNYHSFRAFAEIFGLVPLEAITEIQIELLPTWLNSRFDRSGVLVALDRSVLKRLIASPSKEHWMFALEIVKQCIAAQKGGESATANRTAHGSSTDHWIEEIVRHYASSLGGKLGLATANVFLEWTQRVYDDRDYPRPSHWIRPAIEEHEQNRSWSNEENSSVVALRDSLSAWAPSNDSNLRIFITGLLNSQHDIGNRIAIFIINKHWNLLGALFDEALSPTFLTNENLHENYCLLDMHFEEFSTHLKEKTIEAIRNMPLPKEGKNPDLIVKFRQVRWLSAVAGKNYPPADTFLAELHADEALGEPDPHPEFHVYSESWSGPGPTPYSPEDLAAMAAGGELLKVIEAFEPNTFIATNARFTIHALVDSLERAVCIDPQSFLNILPDFLNARPCFQYGLISGFKSLWKRNAKAPAMTGFSWHVAWESLIDFMGELVGSDDFWCEIASEGNSIVPKRDWIPGLIADFLRDGTLIDDHAYPPELLEASLKILIVILQHSEGIDQPSEDPMFSAINSQRGKAIEAIYSQTLRAARLANLSSNGHGESWTSVVGIFDKEIGKCKNANFEFSTLSGSRLANLIYLDSNWVHEHLEDLFPSRFPANFLCAISGTNYSRPSLAVFTLLREGGVFDHALQMQNLKGDSRQRVLEQIALAYLWGEEPLDSPRFHFLFIEKRWLDLADVANLFWTVRDQSLSSNQVDLIKAFWGRCVDLISSHQHAQIELSPTLSLLACYLDKLGDSEVPLLLAVAPFVNENHSVFELIENLARLAPKHPKEVSQVLDVMFKYHKPTFDYEDNLKRIILSLSASGLRLEALKHLEALHHLDGIDDVFSTLKDG